MVILWLKKMSKKKVLTRFDIFGGTIVKKKKNNNQPKIKIKYHGKKIIKIIRQKNKSCLHHFFFFEIFWCHSLTIAKT